MYNKRDMPVEDILIPGTAKQRFENILTKGTIVCYYHWKLCGHCSAFSPLWKKVIQQYKDKVFFVNIELEGMNGLDRQHRVQGFPTIIIYKNGKKSKEFNGERTAENLNTFIKENVIDVPKKEAGHRRKTTSKISLRNS
jgi:predicted bacteriocin transport accessory protein